MNLSIIPFPFQIKEPDIYHCNETLTTEAIEDYERFHS